MQKYKKFLILPNIFEKNAFFSKKRNFTPQKREWKTYGIVPSGHGVVAWWSRGGHGVVTISSGKIASNFGVFDYPFG